MSLNNTGIASWLSVSEAADALGVNTSRIRQLCASGQLRAERFSNTWAIDSASIEERVLNPYKAGVKSKERMQRADFEWFKQNFWDIYAEHGPGFAVVRDKQVIGFYPTFARGVEAARSCGLKDGEYIVQEVGPNEGCFTRGIM